MCVCVRACVSMCVHVSLCVHVCVHVCVCVSARVCCVVLILNLTDHLLYFLDANHYH